MIWMLIFALIGYGLGSVNSAIIVCKMMGVKDPRSEGSNNPGATNVYRMAGKQAAAVVLLADFFKGALAVWLAKMMGLPDFALGVAGLAVTAGHIFPAFFNFKGGKGVATCLGACFGISMLAGIILVAIWGAIAFAKKYASLASIITCAIAPILMLFGHAAAFLPVAGMAALVIWRHKDNIERLKNGGESKLEF